MLPFNMNMMKKARFVCAISRMTHVARHFLGKKLRSGENTTVGLNY